MPKSYSNILIQKCQFVNDFTERLKELAPAVAYAKKITPLTEKAALFKPPSKRSRYRLMLCEGALSCIEEGDRWGVNFFLRDVMGFRPKHPEALLVLWQELKKDNWRNANDPWQYLKTSLFREFKRRKIKERKDSSFVSLEELELDIADDAGFAELETRLAIEQLAGTLTAEERYFLRLYLFFGSWRMLGLELFGDPDRGRVLGQKITRKLKSRVTDMGKVPPY